MEYINCFKNYLMGKNYLSESFADLLKEYDLNPSYGYEIRENFFKGLFIPSLKDDNIVFKIWILEEFKKTFKDVWSRVHSNQKFNSDILDQYMVTEKYLKQKEEISKVNSILMEYMGEDKLSEEYINDLYRYNLLGGYLEITLKFFLTPLEELQNVNNIREYVCGYLKKLSRKNEVDVSIPQSINEAIEYIILNSGKKIIDDIKFERNFLHVKYIIHNFFSLDRNSALLLDCFNSKYNKYGYKLLIDSGFAEFIIVDHLKDFIDENYDEILKLKLKNRIVETDFEAYIKEEIDEYSLTILKNLFTDELNDILNYYGVNDLNKKRIKNKLYVFCYSVKNYPSKEYRRFRILEMLQFWLKVDLQSNGNSFEKINEYLNIGDLDKITKFDQIKQSLKAVLKYDVYCDLFFSELCKRNLLDFFDEMHLFDNRFKLYSCKGIISFLDDFEKNHDLTIPRSLENAILYLIENNSRNFLDYVYKSSQEDILALHFTLGMWIRNEFGFNQEKNLKLEYECMLSKYYYASFEADNLSHVILAEMWDYVQKNYDELKKTKFTNTIDIYKYVRC